MGRRGCGTARQPCNNQTRRNSYTMGRAMQTRACGGKRAHDMSSRCDWRAGHAMAFGSVAGDVVLTHQRGHGDTHGRPRAQDDAADAHEGKQVVATAADKSNLENPKIATAANKTLYSIPTEQIVHQPRGTFHSLFLLHSRSIGLLAHEEHFKQIPLSACYMRRSTIMRSPL